MTVRPRATEPETLVPPGRTARSECERLVAEAGGWRPDDTMLDYQMRRAEILALLAIEEQLGTAVDVLRNLAYHLGER